ncbi:MAG: hypothetical protein KGK11_05355 [Sphingomonadales bacterium]|nr:hypothetical protein [Sphingomonadales bacterium]
MNKPLLSAAGILALCVLAAPASATVTIITPSINPNPAEYTFTVTPQTGYTVFNAPEIAGVVGDSPAKAAGTYTDDFQFTIPQNGSGTGSITVTSGGPKANGYLDITSVTFDGTAVPISTTSSTNYFFQVAAVSGVPITAYVTNDLVVTYYTKGSGSFGGQLTFEAVPEPATWATAILGFLFIGTGLRMSLRKKTKLGLAG